MQAARRMRLVVNGTSILMRPKSLNNIRSVEIVERACARATEGVNRQLFWTECGRLGSANGCEGEAMSSGCSIVAGRRCVKWCGRCVLDSSAQEEEETLERVRVRMTDMAVKSGKEEAADVSELRRSTKASAAHTGQCQCVAGVSLNVVDLERNAVSKHCRLCARVVQE